MKKLSESTWNDIRKQSAGKQERMEDSINNMDIRQFYDYLKDNYKCIYSEDDISTYMFDILTIRICLYQVESSHYRHIYYDGNEIDTNHDVPSTIGCLKEMEEICTIKTKDRNSINIYPKDGSKITNKFFIEVLDFLLERIDTPLEQKIVKK